MKERIVIVTSGQPSANPRVVKEATALNAAGFQVAVVYAPLSPWADAFDHKLFQDTPTIQWVPAAPHPHQRPFFYKYVRLRRKFYEWLYKLLPNSTIVAQRAFVLYSQELQATANSLPADLYIGHNLGALPAVISAAKKRKVLAAFDAEDYHRGEAAAGSLQHRTSQQLEDFYFPSLTYLSTASPLITKEYQSHFPGKNIFTINNVFSRQYLQPVAKSKKWELSIFWFSQTIGPERGLENIIDALNLLSGKFITLHLLGQCSSLYKKEILNRSQHPTNIFFLEPVPLEQIFTLAAQFDIGLASEVPTCKNREICLTNKLFTYLLSSNCILASNTEAQVEFLNQFNGIGYSYQHNDIEDIAEKISMLLENKDMLDECKQASHILAETKLNWEIEALELGKQVKIVFSERNN